MPRIAEALICTTYYAADEALVGTYYRIRDDEGAIIAGPTLVGGKTSFTVTGLALVVGALYTAEAVHFNATGAGPEYSPPYTARVYDANVRGLAPVDDLPELPGADGQTVITLTLAPSYRQMRPLERPVLQQETESGAIVRRLPNNAQTARAKLAWIGLSGTQKTTVLTQLRTSAELLFAMEMPAGTARELGAGNRWLAERGRMQTRQTGPDVWDVTADVIQVSP